MKNRCAILITMCLLIFGYALHADHTLSLKKDDRVMIIRIIDQFLTENAAIHESMGQDLRRFQYQLENDETLFDESLLVQTIPHIISWIKERAPRIDAPTDLNQAIAGCASPCFNSGNNNGSSALLDELLKELIDCCLTIQNNFVTTFTLLQTGFQATFSIIDAIRGGSCDLTSVITALNACCQGTFTALAQLSVVCDFSGVFTAIADIKNTITACCQQLNNDFQSTFTLIEEIALSVSTTADFAGIFTALQACCAATFSIIADIKANVNQQICAPIIPITTPITITLPGSYCLSNDITGEIIINSSDVILNLNNKTVTSTTTGVSIIADHRNIEVFNGTINTSINAVGILIGDLVNSTTHIAISNIIFNNATGAIIDINGEKIIDGVISECIFKEGSVQAATYILSSTDVTLEKCIFSDMLINSGPFNSVVGFEQCSSIQISKCVVYNNREALTFLKLLSVIDSIVQECELCENFSSKPAVESIPVDMINIDTCSNVIVQKTLIARNRHQAAELFKFSMIRVLGLVTPSTEITIRNCIIRQNRSLSFIVVLSSVYGIRFELNATGITRSSIDSNQVFDNSNNAVAVGGLCQGISIDSSLSMNTNVIVRNVAYSNVGSNPASANFFSSPLPPIITYSISGASIVATPTTISPFNNLSVIL